MTTVARDRLIYWYPQRDKYGRPATYWRVGGGRTVAVTVKLPRTWTELHPDQQYLVNDWTLEHARRGEAVTYYRTRKQALAAARAIAVREGGVG